MDKRKLGRTGVRISAVGFGGIAVMDTDPAEAGRIVGRAIERGIDYFDVAPTYGNAEERLGPALKPFRERVFLACKTTQRKAAGAEEELHRSLARLQTDRFDLYQLHGVSSLADVETIMKAGGAMEVFIRAREQGLIRYIGFSAHTEEAALKLLDLFPFDTVLFPINHACWTRAAFGPAVAAKAVEKGTGLLALKTLARRPWRTGEKRTWAKCWYAPVETAGGALAALAFTLSRGVTAALSPGHAELLWLLCDAAEALEKDPAACGAFEPDEAPLFGVPQ